MLATSKVEGFYGASIGPKKILVATIWGEVLVVTAVLGDLDVPVPSGQSGAHAHVAKLESQLIAVATTDINIEMLAGVVSTDYRGSARTGV